MKKTILSILFLVLSACSIFEAANTQPDSSVATKTNASMEEREALPAAPVEHHQHIDVDAEIPNIAYVMPIAFFLFVLMIIGTSQYFNHKKTRLQTELYMEYLKQGKDIPEQLMVRQKDVSSNLKRGIILMSVGLGVCVFLYSQNIHGNEWTMGAIPFFIGVGYLVVYLLSRKSEQKAQ